MADVSQPSSLTLEPNPFEQSFASKAQEHAALKGGQPDEDNGSTTRPDSGRFSSSMEIPTRHDQIKDQDPNATDAAHKGRPIPGIDKIMTPMPLIPGAVHPAPAGGFQYPLNLINVASPSRWSKQGPFTPSIAGTPTYEGYTALTDPMQHVPGAPGVPGGVNPAGNVAGNPGVARTGEQTPNIPGGPQGPLITPFGGAYGNGMRGPLPLDSPGVMMPMAPGVMFSPVPAQAQYPHQRPPHPGAPPAMPNGASNVPHSNDGGLRNPQLPQDQMHMPAQASQTSRPRPSDSSAQGMSTAANSLYTLSQEGHVGALERKRELVEESDYTDNTRRKAELKSHPEDTAPRIPPSYEMRVKASPPTPRKRSLSSANSEASDVKEELDPKRRNSGGSGKEADLDDNERRRMFLERNRIAAIKCRQRKKQWVNELKAKADIYSQMSDDLQKDNQKLKSDLEQLRQFILTYHDVRSVPHNVLSIINYSQNLRDSGTAGADSNSYCPQKPSQAAHHPHIPVDMNAQLSGMESGNQENAQHI